MTSANAKLTRVSDTLDGGGNTVEPLTLADARNYLKVPDGVTADDAFISDAITAARLQCETINDRSFVTATWDYTLDFFPYEGWGYLGAFAGLFPGFAGFGPGAGWAVDLAEGAIQLPRPPLISVVSIGYVDLSGVAQTIDPAPSAGKVIVGAGTPGRISPAYNAVFPWSRATTGAVVIRFTAGYGPTAATVPRNVVMAIRLLTSLFYNFRSTDAPIPQAVHRLLDATAWGSY